MNKKEAENGVVAKLQANADICMQQCKKSLLAAIESIDKDEDEDLLAGHMLDALMHLGEARGSKNVAVDILEDGLSS